MKQIDSCKDWTYEDIDSCYRAIEEAAAKYELDCYPNQIEVISSEQMLDAYSAIGMPIFYSHWSFGKSFVYNQEMYKRGYMGLAYEIVINSNPCISYLMEENTMAMQALVMAHACIGHNNFFKNNFLFRQWTDADFIIDFLDFAKHKISEYEEKYGPNEVEFVLDACHALQYHGIDRYKRPPARSKTFEEEMKRVREKLDFENFNDIWRTLPLKSVGVGQEKKETFPSEPEENILYFVEKNAPNMPQWKREVIRIVRKISQYFYPQGLTKIMNEGWATFWHYTLMHDLHNNKILSDGAMIEFLHSHTNVVNQRPYSAINPYALGFAMFQDIKRICMEPTEEDREWFPEWAGNGEWLKTLKWAAYNFKDESFILQFLSPKVMRDFRLFHIIDSDENPTRIVNAIHNQAGYKQVREALAQQQNATSSIPNIQVVSVDVWGDRHMELQHYTTRKRSLETEDALQSMWYLSKLWGYPVRLSTVDVKGEVQEIYEVDGANDEIPKPQGKRIRTI